MLRKTLFAAVAVAAAFAAVPAANATVVPKTANFAVDTRSGQQIQYNRLVQYDCSTNTFSGSGGTLTTFASNPFRQVETPAPNATLSGTVTRPGVNQSFVTFSISVLGINLTDVTLAGYGGTYFTGAPAYGSGSPYLDYRLVLDDYGQDANGNWVDFPTCRRFPAVVSADQCKGNGFTTVSSADDVTFKNQGDCVSYVTTKGKNAPAGS